MNVIFGKDKAELLGERYTVLALDTVRYGTDGRELELFCTVDDLSVDEMAALEDNCEKHKNLIQAYRTRDWQTASRLIVELRGLWSGELDSFYSNLATRIENLIETPPDDSWDYVITR
jgi:hypothetical protein